MLSSIEKKLVSVSAIVAAMSALLVVPEVREYFGLDKAGTEVALNEASNKNLTISNGILPSKPSLGIPGVDVGLNYLIYNASSVNDAHRILKSKILNLDTRATIDSNYMWANRWEMSITRVYFLGPKNRENAYSIASWLGDTSEVIDYYAQLKGTPLKFPDKPSRYSSRMVGIDSHRDIMIFVGNDLIYLLSSAEQP
ncbi:hypothetical protein [Nitrosomonas sp.]|uniref:hypothetical protein n=1 Tax=Nitrosomonas sp. TaxID=42353 RepID=UPI001D8826A6|nr:hypothetical protein [Nitrosomonas sp.]MCB1949398.1 hypothetical protein [Nitrosomonas sp.]